MVLDSLGEKLKNTLGKISKALFVDEKLLDEILRDIQRALLQADVNVQLVFKLTKSIKERAQKENIPGLDKKEHLIKIVYEELVQFLGGEKKEPEINKKPTKLMLVGLFGAGKTTTSGKIAKYYTKRGKKVALVGLDVWRPAAMKQLEQVGKTIGVDTYVNQEEKDPIQLWNNVKDQLGNYDLVIIDTAGRDALSEELITEIEEVTKTISPDEKILVLQADIGQAAQKQAEQFHKSCEVTGVIISKMDGSAKGGGALTACAVTGAPIMFIGVGERPDDFESFNPKGFVSRMLGMGDLDALLEKAELAMKGMDNEDMQKKLMKGDFDLNDLYEQMSAMKKMGSLSKIMDLLPGMGGMKIPKDALKVQDEKLTKWKFIIDSCTPFERANPDQMSGSRVERIAKGSGTTVQQVRELLKQYKMSKKLMKTMGGSEKKMQKMMAKMQGGGLPR